MHNRSSLIIQHKGESWLFKPAEEEDNVLNYYKIESIGDRISGFDQRERKVLLWNFKFGFYVPVPGIHMKMKTIKWKQGTDFPLYWTWVNVFWSEDKDT